MKSSEKIRPINQEELNKVYFHSTFNFLMEHKGFRPNCLHGLLGTSGSGKSTLLKKIVAETSKDHRVLLWLSEESAELYFSKWSEYYPDAKRENIQVFEEATELRPEQTKDAKTALQTVFDIVETAQPEIIFIDNLTTSELYSESMGLKGQSLFIKGLKKLCMKYGNTILFLIHTDKNTHDNGNKIIEGENVRGLNRSFMDSDYFYILQRFENENNITAFVRLRKRRNHDQVNTNYFLLKYIRGVYVSDLQSNFGSFNSAYLERNFLGKKTNGGGSTKKSWPGYVD